MTDVQTEKRNTGWVDFFKSLRPTEAELKRARLVARIRAGAKVVRQTGETVLAVLIILKLHGLTPLSWWWVFSPVWGVAAVAVPAALIVAWMGRRNRELAAANAELERVRGEAGR